ncbi:NUDIX hydrolase [Halioxenophilus aromaticivorans]|uniref:CoA pyrophosphatase n=1 Tax=Halioxenophilus aromaticivorans TaxID=1306992 RepID=A0AAV3U0P4_9ALTE
MTKLLEKKLKPLKMDYESYYPTPDAAVLLALYGQVQQPQLILTQRATHLNSHAGEVSFPGGKWEPADTGPGDTALRETEEEIALPRRQVALLGELPDHFSKKGLRVKPIVGWVDELPDLIPSPDELDAVFSVPLEFFLADQRIRTDIYSSQGVTYWSPAWQFEQYEIWGLTARILVDLLNDVFDANLGRLNPAPERLRV